VANEPGSRRAPTDTEGWAAGAIRSVAAIRHVAFEDLGLLEPLLRDRGATIRYLEAGVDELSGSAVAEADLLVVLGGPIGVYEDKAYPFLRQEIASVERRLAAGRPTLGICLGSQIMARALGARVFPSGAKEVGWGPVELTPAGQRSALSRLDGVPVLHWHGDTFDLPPGATLLASTEVCRHQAFQWGGTALGLQFHIEVTATGLERWFIGHTGEIASTPGLSVAALRADSAIHAPALARRGREFIGDWLDALSPG
jgi:GMP synthase (glutamine-hydrolysing)